MVKGITLDNKKLGNGDPNIEFEIEPYTGITVHFKYAFEVAVYIDDNTVFPSLQKKLIPIMRIENEGGYSDEQIAHKFIDLSHKLVNIYHLRVSLMVIGGILGAIGGLTTSIRYRKGESRSSNSYE